MSFYRFRSKLKDKNIIVIKPATAIKPSAAKPKIPEYSDMAPYLKKVFQFLEGSNDHIFVTGRAGTGKSTLLRYLRDNTKKRCAVLAPTGVAAINAGGQTIHSFFKFPPRIVQKEKIHIVKDTELIKKLDLVLIDEISMVRADLLDGVDFALRLNRNRMREPFGGVQVLFFGDLYQLPPVVKGDEKTILEQKYDSPYFIDAAVMKNKQFAYLELESVFRQTDERFIEILSHIRNNALSDDDLAALSDQVIESIPRQELYITLTMTNGNANAINMTFLDNIKSQGHRFEAIITGKFKEEEYPTEQILNLKEGAQVIMLKNDQDKRWVNGTLAKIKSIKNGRIFVEISGNEYAVEKAKWEHIEYEYDKKEDKIKENIVGSFEQYPMRLAWAITVHKSQGQTFDNVFIDFESRAFAHGQAYVALSRCRTLKGVHLARPLSYCDIILDERIHAFRNRMNRVVVE